MPGGESGPDVLVKRAHDNDGERGVKKVVAPNKPAVKNTLPNILVSRLLVGRGGERKAGGERDEVRESPLKFLKHNFSAVKSEEFPTLIALICVL